MFRRRNDMNKPDGSQKLVGAVLYFGIFDENFSRNKIYADGLRQNGIKVIICNDNGKGFKKYWSLFKKHWALRNDYDMMIVGFPGFIVVPFAKLVSLTSTRKPVVFDALCSFYETQIISRDAYKGNIFRIPYVRMIDWLATRCADKILVETEKQRQYFIKDLGTNPSKCVVVYTGVDDLVFRADPTVKKAPEFTVLFRGRITKEAGAVHVLRAAKLLEDTDIRFLIIGFGWGEPMDTFRNTLSTLKLENVRYIDKQLPSEELVGLMLQCSVSLGQFEDNERLKRTIPHKAFESLSMKIPYITARTGGVEEVMSDGKDCLMCRPADPEDLAAKIKAIRDDPRLAGILATNGYILYLEKFTPAKIVEPILKLIKSHEKNN